MKPNATSRDEFEPSPAQRVAAEILAAGGTAGEAAASAGVSRVTIRRWSRSNIPFICALHEAIRSRREALAKEHRDTAAQAVKVVVDLMGEQSPASVRLKAASAILSTLGGLPEPPLAGSIDPLEVQEEVTRQEENARFSRLFGGSIPPLPPHP